MLCGEPTRLPEMRKPEREGNADLSAGSRDSRPQGWARKKRARPFGLRRSRMIRPGG